MRPFIYQPVSTMKTAVQAGAYAPAADASGAVHFLAGGTTLLDLMKLDVTRPGKVVDINALATGPAGRIKADEQGLRLCEGRHCGRRHRPSIKWDRTGRGVH